MLSFLLVDSSPPTEEGDTVLNSPDGVADDTENDEEHDDDDRDGDVSLNHIGGCEVGREVIRVGVGCVGWCCSRVWEVQLMETLSVEEDRGLSLRG